MELRATSRYVSRALGDGESDVDVVGPVSIDGLEVVDEQVVALAPVDSPEKSSGPQKGWPGRRRHRERDHVLG